VVQFPNDVCTTTTSSSTFGTCLTSSECTDKGGNAAGNCAAGFGVCCYIATSTCGSTISTNNTYIQNPGYPSSYTPASTSETCAFTINKVSDDICQVRLDFQTFSGLTVTTAGVCTDTFAIAGQTGVNPPSICGTNTGYHMYAELGAAAGDTGTVTLSYGSTSPAKHFNVFVQQIECDNVARAPVDCVQYFTGTSNTVNSYGWAGGQLLEKMDYRTCVRREKGYCAINWSETSGTTIDAFSIFSTTTATNAIYGSAAASGSGICIVTAKTGIMIPKTSMDGITPLLSTSAPTTSAMEPFPDAFCGGIFGMELDLTTRTLTSVQMPFQLHLITDPTATIDPPSTGFSLDYTQTACDG